MTSMLGLTLLAPLLLLLNLLLLPAVAFLTRPPPLAPGTMQQRQQFRWDSRSTRLDDTPLIDLFFRNR